MADRIRFQNEVNASLAVGDVAYYVNSDGDNVRIGDILSIADDRRSFTVNRGSNVPPATAGEFIFFVKNKSIESSGIIGYEAMVTMTNASTKKAELYAVSSEVFESSK